MKKRVQKDPAVDSGTLNRKQLMEKLGMCQTSVWRAMRFLGLPYRKVGRKVWFLEAEVTAWQNNLPGQRPAGTR